MKNHTHRQLRIFDELIIDSFAGGGGASTGIEQAIGRPVDIAINHDPEAIAMHQANHPHTRHYCESVWDVDPLEATQGKPVGLAWFSPDCKHFSKAKGGKPRDKNIRGLAWVALDWAKKVKPRIIFLENVEEFQTWGPLLEDGRPCPIRKGETFAAFVESLKKLGYVVEWRMLRACDFGAPTIRRRLFLVARCDGQSIVWPEPTHGKPDSEGVNAGRLKPWRTAAECIDWSLTIPSIFDRKKPLAEATLRRIARGIQKYVIDAKEPFIVTCNHAGDGFRGSGLNEPLKTLTAARDAHGLVAPTLIQTGYGQHSKQKPRVPGLDKPLGTCMAEGIKHGLVAASLAKHYDGNYQAAGLSVDEPLHTITTQDHHALLAAHLIRMFGTSTGGSLNEPSKTVMSAGGGGKSGLVAVNLCRHYGESNGTDVGEPAPTIMSGGGGKTSAVYSFLSRFNGNPDKGEGVSLDHPTGTVTSKDRFALVTVNQVEYVIADIGMRMLEPHELYRAQGFPESYEIAPIFNGKRLSKTAQVRMVGNSVCPPVAAALVKANYEEQSLLKRTGT